MKKNLHAFDDPAEYITQQQLVETIRDIQRAMWALHKWLDQQITEVEKELAAEAP